MADLYAAIYNPDVLSCLANLSNDEVFTPPEMANRVLDMLPESLWSDPNAKFLDPCSKSGVFLREIAKRLIRGQMPDFDQCMTVIDYKRANGEDLSAVDNAYLERLQPVLDHIFREQLFGIGITQLTALMTRRSLYCSKWANGRYSVVEFDSSEGNIRYRNLQHTWVGEKGKERCRWCGASKQELEDGRSSDETYAYELIHTPKPERIFEMQFDVIIGNPPYQMGDGGAQKSAVPIYHKFIEQAKKLNPRYLTMIVPARWYAGGRGLDAFRQSMLSDTRIRELHDFPETSDCFEGINIRGGVCYFLWDREYNGDCRIVNHRGGVVSESVRPLLEEGSSILIRHNEAVDILRKVKAFGEESFSQYVSSSKPFGLRGFFKDFKQRPSKDAPIKLYRFGENGYVNKDQILKNAGWADRWKVIIPEASPGGDEYPHLVLSVPIISEPGSICTETYLVIGPFDDRATCENVASYIKTKFFRFLVLMIKNTQHTTQKVYQFVPVQDFSKPWCDEELYQKYGFTDEDIQFVDSLVKER